MAIEFNDRIEAIWAPDPSNRPRYKLTNKGATVLRLLREDGTI